MSKALALVLAITVLCGASYYLFVKNAEIDANSADTHSSPSLISENKRVLNRELNAQSDSRTEQTLVGDANKASSFKALALSDKQEAQAIAALSDAALSDVARVSEFDAGSVKLWEISSEELAVDDRVSGHPIKLNAEDLSSLQPGHQLDIAVPGASDTLSAKINKTFNQLGDVKVWQGSLAVADNFDINGQDYQGHAQDNIIISRGAQSTHVTIATRAGTYTAVIDNKTGAGHIVNEAEYLALQDHDVNDAVSVPFTPTTPAQN